MTAQPKHSSLGASIAKRWWSCPGSVKACEGIQNQSTVYAAEGQAAHALGELCLRNQHHPERYLDQWIGADGTLYPDKEPPEKTRGTTVFYIDEDMVEAVAVYVQFFFDTYEDGDEYEIEQRIDLSQFHPGLYGTADLVIYKPAKKHLIVVDYKHGRGVPVEVRENVQGLYYAAGAAFKGANRGITNVEIVIVQPRCSHKDGGVRKWSTTPMELMDWVADLVEAAKKTEKPDAPLQAGDWCKFCPAAPVCVEFKNAALVAAKADFASDGAVILSTPSSYNPEVLAQSLRNVDIIESWCRSIKKFAHDEAIAGRVVPGFKLVNTRATRKWKEPEKTMAKFQLLELDISEYLTEPELKSVAQVEKAIGKKGFAAFVSMVESRSSGVTLAPLEDKREAVRPEAAAEFA